MRTALRAFALFLGLAGNAPAATPVELSKIQIEAAYLYNFARFVEWPGSAFANAQSPIVIGVIGQDPFGSLLDDLVTGEKIHGRSLVIRRFARVQEIGDCHILFIPRAEADQSAQICAALQNHHVLTVSDIPGFVRQGGMIELVEDQERIRFRIALKRARSESLEISAKLLRPAEVVSRTHCGATLARLIPQLTDRDVTLGLADLVLPALVELTRLPLPSVFPKSFF